MSFLSENQEWWRPYAELTFWLLVGVGLMMFSAYHPSADDLTKGMLWGGIVAAWGQFMAKTAEMRTKTSERAKTSQYLERSLSGRVGEPITEQTVKEVSHEIKQRPTKQ